jgi:hypothetical protein
MPKCYIRRRSGVVCTKNKPDAHRSSFDRESWKFFFAFRFITQIAMVPASGQFILRRSVKIWHLDEAGNRQATHAANCGVRAAVVV